MSISRLCSLYETVKLEDREGRNSVPICLQVDNDQLTIYLTKGGKALQITVGDKTIHLGKEQLADLVDFLVGLQNE